MRNMWRRTAQAGLWFTAGSLAQCRIFSRYLAIQIKALEEGLINVARPSRQLRASHSSAFQPMPTLRPIA